MSDYNYKSFRIQIGECLKNGTCLLKPCDKTTFSFHNGPIHTDQEHWCNKYNCPCKSGVCRDERVTPKIKASSAATKEAKS